MGVYDERQGRCLVTACGRPQAKPLRVSPARIGYQRGSVWSVPRYSVGTRTRAAGNHCRSCRSLRRAGHTRPRPGPRAPGTRTDRQAPGIGPIPGLLCSTDAQGRRCRCTCLRQGLVEFRVRPHWVQRRVQPRLPGILGDGPGHVQIDQVVSRSPAARVASAARARVGGARPQLPVSPATSPASRTELTAVWSPWPITRSAATHTPLIPAQRSKPCSWARLWARSAKRNVSATSPRSQWPVRSQMPTHRRY